ncbi:MAG: M48 family metalloprotease [bacterium]
MKTTFRAHRILCGLLIGGLALLIIAGCASVAKFATENLQEQGVIDENQAASINRTAEALEKTFTDITPEQEYYIGRAVAATILKTYPPADDPEANEYLNLLGQTLAKASDRPGTYGGYHFLLLDTDEINAFAAPGGLILVSRGLVECCQSEDALAAVLAHEIGHVVLKHGLRAIKSSRLTSALTILSVEAAKNLGSKELAQLTEEFEGSIMDVTSTLISSGYSRGLELEADQSAVTVLERIGYNPRALLDMLHQMKARSKPGSLGFAKTHPDPEDRVHEVQGALLQDYPPVSEPAVRHQRFTRAMRVG